MTHAEKYLHLESRQVTTKFGKRTVRKIPISESFWTAWRANKESMKKEGISVGKNPRTGAWEAALWTAPEEEAPAVMKTVESKPVSEHVKSKLLGHQAEHVAQLRSVIESRGAAMDMSETGTGKTYTAAGLAKEMGLHPIFITKVANIKEATRVFEEHMGIKDPVVVNYEMLRTGKMRDKNGKTVDAPFLHKVENPAKGEPAFEWNTSDKDLIIFDESHKGKNKGTLNTEMMRAAAKAKQKGTKILLSSATPAENPIKFRAQGEALGLFKGNEFFDWARKYGGRNVPIPGGRGRTSFQFQGGPEDMKRMNEDVMQKVAVRTRLREVAKDFPENKVTASSFDMGKDTKKIEKARQQMSRSLANLEARKKEIGGREAQSEALAERQKLAQEIEILKAPTVADEASNVIERGGSAVILVKYTETAQQLKELLGDDAALYTGAQSKAEKDFVREAFQKGDKRIFIGNIAAAGESISLHDTTGDHPRTSFIMTTDSAQDIKQALGRISRAGAVTPARQHIVFAEGVDIEEEMMANVNAKLANLDALTDVELGGGIKTASEAPTEASDRGNAPDADVAEVKPKMTREIAANQRWKEQRLAWLEKELSYREKPFTEAESIGEHELEGLRAEIKTLKDYDGTGPRPDLEKIHKDASWAYTVEQEKTTARARAKPETEPPRAEEPPADKREGKAKGKPYASSKKGKSGEGSGKNAYWGAVQKHRDAGEPEGTAREHGEQDMKAQRGHAMKRHSDRKASDFYMVESLAKVNDDFTERDDAIRKALDLTNTTISDYDCLYDLHDFMLEAKDLQDFQASIHEALSTIDDVPLSIKVAIAVNEHLEQLVQARPDDDFLSLLRLAYDIARREVVPPVESRDFVDDFILADDASAKGSLFSSLPTLSPSWTSTNTSGTATDNTIGETYQPMAKKDYFFATESPVSSSNVAEVGYNNGKLIVYFNNGWGYTYDVDPDFYDRMMAATSKGSFVWDELRGRRPGHVIDMPQNKTPGGVPGPFGEGALVPYDKIKGLRTHRKDIDKHIEAFAKTNPPIFPTELTTESAKTTAPVQAGATSVIPALKPGKGRPAKDRGTGKQGRIAKPKASKQMEAPAPSSTFTDIWKHVNMPVTSTAKTTSGDTTTAGETAAAKSRLTGLRQKVGQLRAMLKAPGLTPLAREAIQLLIDATKKGLTRSDFFMLAEALNDHIHASDDMVVLHGPITRGGAFDYKDAGHGVLVKDYKQLKETFKKYYHLPVFGSRSNEDLHGEHRMVGFATNWEYKDDTEQIEADVYPFPDIEEELSANGNDGKKFPVSIRSHDDRLPHEKTQDISSVLHLAVSLDGTGKDRCSTANGLPCYVSLTNSQGTTVSDFVADDSPDDKKGDTQKTKQKAKKMPKDKDDIEDVDDTEESDEETEGAEADDASNKDKDASDDFVKLSKDEYAKILTKQKEIDDFMEKQKEESKKREVEATVAMRGKLKDHPWLVADFVEKADLKTLEILQAGVRPVPADSGSQTRGMFPEDFANPKPEEFKNNKWGTAIPQKVH